MQAANLTDSYVSQLSFAPVGQYLVRDTLQPGFFVVVGVSSKTYTVQISAEGKNGKRTSKRKAVGKASEISARAARNLARQAVSELQTEAKESREPKAVCLMDAWLEYQSVLVENKRSKRTIEGYRHHIETYFKEWHAMPLIALAQRPGLVKLAHKEISANRGKYAANGAMRTLRAVYNESARTNLELRRLNPVEAVRFNLEERRQTALTPEDLKNWFGQLDEFDNKIRRYFHILTLVTGSRPTALKQAEWKDIDFKNGKWTFPRPKGGAIRGFDIPISKPLADLLNKLQLTASESHPMGALKFLFPAFTKTGYIEEHKETRGHLSHWGNDLRQSFRTFATMANINEVFIRIFMNHRMRDVSIGYLNLLPMWVPLTEAQSSIIKKIEELAMRPIQ